MRESFNAHTLDIAVMVMLTLLKTMKMMMMMMMMIMICPGCYTKLPSGTTPTFSRIFSMEKNWSTSIKYFSTYSIIFQHVQIYFTNQQYSS